MKRFLALLCQILLVPFLLTSCGPTESGPTSWIDKPLDSSNYPLEPLEIIAHASSPSGVSSVEVTIDGQVLDTIRAGDGRFETASLLWHPSEPGVYTIGVTALDSKGNPGNQAVSVITLDNDEEITEYGNCDNIDLINFFVVPDVVAPGNCTDLFWEVSASEDIAVIIDGYDVPPSGEYPLCPEETRQLEMIIESSAGICRQWETVYVEGQQESNQNIIFTANPPEISRGECSLLFWEVSPEGEVPPVLDGSEVPFWGENEVCPSETTVYHLQTENSPDTSVTVEVLDGESDEEYIYFAANPPVINRGECSILVWEVRPFGDILPTIDGYEVGFDGEYEICLEETTNFLLVSEFIPEYVLTVEVIDDDAGGNKPVEVTSTPTAKPYIKPTDTPTPDTTPPKISKASVSPNDFIYNTNGSCSPTTFKFSVKVTDASGISSVVLNWSGSGVRNGPEYMNFSGGKYVNNLGLFVNTGSLSNFSITATDNAGNTKTKNLDWSLDVEECGGS